MNCAAKHVKRLRSAAVALAIFISHSAVAMDLLAAYRAAVENDATFLSVQAASGAKREVLPQARAMLLPQLSASGAKYNNDTHSERTVTGSGGKKTTISDDNSGYGSYNQSVTLRQPLFRMANIAGYGQAQALVESADAAEDKGRQDLALKVVSTYFSVLTAQDGLAQLVAQRESYKAQLDASQRAFQAGQGTRTEIEEAQARYDFTVAQEIISRETISSGLEQLQALVDKPVPSVATLLPERLKLIPPVPNSLEEWVRLGEESSPELRRLAADIEAADKGVLKAQAGHFPTLDLVAQRSRTENDSVTAQNAFYDNKQIGVQLTIPLFSSGYVSSTVAEARQNLAKARYDHEAQRRDLRVQIRRQFQGVSDGIEEIRALEQALRSAEQAIVGTRKGVQAGTRTTLDVLNAEDKKATVHRDLSRARYRYIVARVALLALAGGDTLAEIERINTWLTENQPAK